MKNIKTKIDETIKLKKFNSLESGSLIINKSNYPLEGLIQKVINLHKDKNYTIIDTLKYDGEKFTKQLLDDVNQFVINDKSLFIVNFEQLDFNNVKIYAAYLTLLKYSSHNNVKMLVITNEENFKRNKKDFDIHIDF